MMRFKLELSQPSRDSGRNHRTSPSTGRASPNPTDETAQPAPSRLMPLGLTMAPRWAEDVSNVQSS